MPGTVKYVPGASCLFCDPGLSTVHREWNRNSVGNGGVSNGNRYMNVL